MTSSVTVIGHEIERVKSFKYLSTIILDDTNIKLDIDSDLEVFPYNFNEIYSKFYYLKINVLSFLFHTFTYSF